MSTLFAPIPIGPIFTLLTSGMDDLDMQVPPGLEDFALAELCLCLPDEWPLAINEFGWREPDFFWPIQILKQRPDTRTGKTRGSAMVTPSAA